jgi:hypothetical protein
MKHSLRFKSFFLIVILFFVIFNFLILIGLKASTTSSDDWSVGVEVGTQRTVKVNYCSGICEKITP